MTETTIDVNTATREELLTHARQELGLKVNSSINKNELRQLVAEQTGQSVIAGAGTEMSPKETEMMAKLNKEPRINIRIFENQKHPRFVHASVNGVDFWMKPGAQVSVPRSVVGVLRTAIRCEITQVEENGKLVNVQQMVQSYPFEVCA